MTTVNNPNVSAPSDKGEDPKQKGSSNHSKSSLRETRDWADLIAKLAIPIVVLIATIGFGWWQSHLADLQHQNDQKLAQQQHQQDQQRALDQQQAAILQTYIDNIQDLLLNHNLLKSKPTDYVAILARARTVTALQGLDPERKGRLMIFLHEAHLIGFTGLALTPFDPIIDLKGADLSYADLSTAELSGAYLQEANLRGADLRGADLSYANLTRASLKGAKLDCFAIAIRGGEECDETSLFRATLTSADLSFADLSSADLGGAILNEAELSNALDLTQNQLDQVYSCKYAALPPGLTCHHNQTPP